MMLMKLKEAINSHTEFRHSHIVQYEKAGM